MPLVILCGIPCSGKSETAKKLLGYLQQQGKKAILVMDSNIELGSQRNLVYADPQMEKQLRSSLKSEVERHLSKTNVVILDAGNYIKGYRYELYCLSKACKTTHCVIHCDLLPDDCWEWNEKQPTEVQYEKDIFYALVQRFEAPESRNRWDSPLFIKHKDEELPLPEVDDALFVRKAPPPNQSTECAPLASTNFLHDLDRTTQEIVKVILESQRTCIPGDFITVPKAEQKILLLRTVTAGELTKIRRQFISYTKSHPTSDDSKLPNMFVQFVNKSI